ncbi:RE1 [Symbiodinium sp. CCMP2592]|nr:RE1 [Symbiodinium sp. CCMP2592]
MYAYGNHYGVTNKTKQFPQLTQYIHAYMQHHHKKPLGCNAILVSCNAKHPVHRDLHNDAEVPNVVIGLGNYRKGRLWVATSHPEQAHPTSRKVLPNGQTVVGQYHDIYQKAHSFYPKEWHGPEAWTGTRWVISAYCSRGSECLGSEDQGLLQTLGFSLRKPASESHKHEVHANEEKPKEAPMTTTEKERIRKQLYLLHAATGHGSTRHLIEALKRRKAKPEVLELAKQFKCSICAEKQKVTPRHLASLEVLPPRFHTIAADIGHWQHPRTKESHQFMLIVDEGSRFRVARFLAQGSKQQPNAATCLQYLREGWSQYFGLPRTLRLDPAGAFRSEAVVSFCERNGIFLDNIPADAHWQLGVCEQAVHGLKTVMTKLVDDDDDITAEGALTTAVQTFNSREQIRGFSPMQHVFGQSPDTTGRIIGATDRVPEELITESATSDLQAAALRRASAEKALADWQASQRISRAMNSRTRPVFDYQPGELVYYWRSQVSGQSRKHPGSKHGYFLGPARILATEQRRDAEGHLYPGSAVWCVRGRHLVKCCPEQLRRASEREELLEALAGEHTGDATPWSFDKVAEEIGGNQYEDVSQERPPPEEWRRAQDPEQEVPPARFRVRGKRALPQSEAGEMEVWNEEDATPSQPSRPSRRIETSNPQGLYTKGEAWYTTVPENSWSTLASSYWSDQTAAVEVEVELPNDEAGFRRATNNLRAYFTGALRRRAVEVHERHLNDEERTAFKAAKEAEVRNFVAAEAFEALPEGLRPSKDQAVNMRWLLTWKVREDGSRKAKARAVLLGYQDPSYAQRETAAPVMSRQTRQCLLQIAANNRWDIHKGDVTGAFLQGRSYPDTLYCIPTDEICQAMGLKAGTITRLRRACYGLVDAPLEWYRTVSEFFEEIGLTRSWSDACCWTYRVGGVLKGLIAGHVDDFLFTGSSTDKGWQDIIEKIKTRFKWGDWDTNDFVQCGVQIRKTAEGFELSQERYVTDIPDVPLNSQRRKDSQEPTTPWEKTKLRASLGALSWHAQQTAPHVAAEVGLLLSEVNCSTVATIQRVNQLVQWTKARKDYKLQIHGFGPSEVLGVYAWVDAAVNGEDEMFFLRFQWSELMYGIANVREKDQIVSRVPGCVITDSRNVYDKMMSEVVSIKGAEKRANIELLGLKESQWAGSKELELYYKMGFKWRIVEDEKMRSARRRKAQGAFEVPRLQPVLRDGREVANFAGHLPAVEAVSRISRCPRLALNDSKNVLSGHSGIR